ncbi:hypothetical protein MAPG_11933 [Magnaporthiopsis poae ATCC 64411]|uniref:Uncharacterized protein n=1 Tax=Magnaporthiopsis poae (strain ATCC 64411 / 73-15) TaxID=644358 RepID=A0A0C4EGI4_MAGP6|nr:hypothetical protein MAPG_11933 [Magnaporthiopsis poae ATCC 64411]
MRGRLASKRDLAKTVKRKQQRTTEPRNKANVQMGLSRRSLTGSNGRRLALFQQPQGGDSKALKKKKKKEILPRPSRNHAQPPQGPNGPNGTRGPSGRPVGGEPKRSRAQMRDGLSVGRWNCAQQIPPTVAVLLLPRLRHDMYALGSIEGLGAWPTDLFAPNSPAGLPLSARLAAVATSNR